MDAWWSRRKSSAGGSPEQRIRSKYVKFRELLALNNDCLELLASVQEDLHYASPTPEVLGDRVGALFDRTANAVNTLEHLTGKNYRSLAQTVARATSPSGEFCCRIPGAGNP